MILQPGEALTLVASTEAAPGPDGVAAYEARQAYEQQLITRSGHVAVPAEIQHLVLAADQLVVRRPMPNNLNDNTIIAGYPWFGD